MSHNEDLAMAKAVVRELRPLLRRSKGNGIVQVHLRTLIAFDSELRRLRRLIRKRVEHQLVEEYCGLDRTKSIARWHELMKAIGMKPRCRRCGCTEARACPGGCAWIEVGLCSACDETPDPLRRSA